LVLVVLLEEESRRLARCRAPAQLELVGQIEALVDRLADRDIGQRCTWQDVDRTGAELRRVAESMRA
jgi:hypothetical protein